MAIITLYDQQMGRSYSINADVFVSVINGANDGAQAYYIKMTTTATDPGGNTIPPRVLTDSDVTNTISVEIRAQIADVLTEIEGGYMSSSSSSESSPSSGGSSLSSQSSESSSSDSSLSSVNSSSSSSSTS